MGLLCCFGDRDRDPGAVPSQVVEAGNRGAERVKPKASLVTSPTGPVTMDQSGSSAADKKQEVPKETAMETSISSSNSNMADKVFAPPPGPPPHHTPQSGPSSAPGFMEEDKGNPPPYHDWETAVPDTTTFPPPPIPGYLYSNTGNASSDDAERAHNFCNSMPLWRPVKPSAAVYNCVQNYDLRPVRPAEFNGNLTVISNGRWKGSTKDRNGDCVLLTSLPLYFPVEDSPLITKRSKTIYFEVKLLGLRAGPGTGSGDASGFAIGFAAQPYPTWRSPGWERGSVGVFSDDGCRFVNDSWGGKEFTTAFDVGETVGLGMTFSLPDDDSVQAAAPGARTLKVDIFFTRNGQKTGGWDLHEEVDEEAGSIEGLEGDFDLYGAVGLFGGVDFEVCFDPAGWLWRGHSSN